MTKWVYSFGNGAAEGAANMRNLLGGKGANLAEMSSLGLPVPPGFTITTEVCTWYYEHEKSYPDALTAQVAEALEKVGEATTESLVTRNGRCWFPSAPAPCFHARHDGYRPEPRP